MRSRSTFSFSPFASGVLALSLLVSLAAACSTGGLGAIDARPGDVPAAASDDTGGVPATAPCEGDACPKDATKVSCMGTRIEVRRLFPSATPVAPLTEKLANGTLRTHGAGRVRGRHENEAEFSKYHESYFDKRAFGFTIDDEVAAGGTKLLVTWRPEHKNNGPNVRVFYTGNGNVFHVNAIMAEKAEADGTFTYTFEVDRNARENRALKVDDVVEIEFGVFLAPPFEGRTNYYTDTYRYRVGTPGLLALPDAPAAMLSGGAATVRRPVVEPELAFKQHALNMPFSSLREFLPGRRLFHTDMTTGQHTQGLGPVIPELVNAAGPVLGATSCAQCHAQDGRAIPATTGAMPDGIVVKVGATAGGPHPLYGQQLQGHAVAGVAPEASVKVTWKDVPGAFADGTAYSLVQPVYAFEGAQPIGRSSVRVARELVGLGILEALDEQDLLVKADPDDCDGDGISGRPNVVTVGGEPRMGRFGWKAGKTSVEGQVAEALVLDSGVTSRLFPKEDCGVMQKDCLDRQRTGAPEMNDEGLGRLVAYMRGLGTPARAPSNPVIVRGEAIFAGAGCTSCHTPTARTGMQHPLAELRGLEVHPYSDLLLHDLGDDLADSLGERDATPREWRTAPLWGIGMLATVSTGARYLHDGRARTLLEAVLWHGGEAAPARERVRALPASDRSALEAFLQSL